MKKNHREYIGVIQQIEYPNIGSFRQNGNTILFKGGIVGQQVRIQRKRRKGEAVEGKLVEILEASPLETMPGCPASGQCGGCSYQKMDYQDELTIKQNQIKRLYAGLFPMAAAHILPAPSNSGYRNKMEYTFGDTVKDGPLILGLHRRNHFYEIVDTIGCNIVPPDFESIRQAVQGYFRKSGTRHLRKGLHSGLLRHLILRMGFHSGEIMVNLVTTSQEDWNQREFVLMLNQLRLEGQIVSIFHTVNDSLADAVIAEKVHLLYGQDHITETILGLDFSITPFSFFQPNPIGAENLYAKVLEMAGDISGKTVFDLYSGTGTIGQIMAKHAKEVIGIEILAEAVEAARKNAKENKLSNITFLAGDVLEEMDHYQQEADVIVIDPPREGIHPKALDKIVLSQPDKIIYVSCNPKSQVRDLAKLLENGYEVREVEIFDQFPRTVHVETVCLLSKIKE